MRSARSHRFTVRLTRRERAELAAIARRRRVAMSAVAREAIRAVLTAQHGGRS